MQKKFEKYQEFFKTLKFSFSAVRHSETQFESLDLTKNSNYRLYGNKYFHQTRDGLCILLRNTLSYEGRSDLSVNSDAIECLCLESQTKNLKIQY